MPIDANAQPDVRTRRLQVLLAARGGCRQELAGRMEAEASKTSGQFGHPGRVTLLVQVDDDPFPRANPLLRPYDAVLEVESTGEAGVQSFSDAVDGIGERLADVVHGDLSAVLIGAPQVIIPCEPTPVRYLYLMRRKAGTTREAYIDHYFHNHSGFGFRTPAIAGYTQFHVDLAESAVLSHRLGFGVWAFDSVSELYMDSLEDFLARIAEDERLGVEATADEVRFVDRDNSVSFTTRTSFAAGTGG
jgi:hypothetical protein